MTNSRRHSEAEKEEGRGGEERDFLRGFFFFGVFCSLYGHGKWPVGVSPQHPQ